MVLHSQGQYSLSRSSSQLSSAQLRKHLVASESKANAGVAEETTRVTSSRTVEMGRVSLLIVVLCVSTVMVRADDDPWFHDPFESSPPPADAPPPPLYPTPVTPSPYYDSPPYADAPTDPPAYSPPVYSPPSDGPSPSPWWSCGLWAQKTDSWPAPYKPDTPVGDAFGSDALSVYGQVSMFDGVTSKGDDGYSDLLKQGITALLNAIDKHFKYTEDEIKKCFSFKTALSSEAAATMQAKEFEDANESVTNNS